MKMNVVSLFSGLGGMDLGIVGGFDFLGNHYSKTIFEIQYAMDFDKPTCEIYNENFEHPCNYEDITQLNAENLPVHDVLIGGFPCQSFSVSAQNPPRLGYKDPRGKLFFEMCRILKHHQPRFLLQRMLKEYYQQTKRKLFL